MSLTQNGCLVVLDTGPAREIAEEADLPEWIPSFLKMKGEGYRFSLADNACAELINQRAKDAIKDEGFQVMIEWLTKLLDAGMPMLPGARDIMIEIGAEPGIASDRSVAEVSLWAWDTLRRTVPGADTGVDVALEQERADWKEQFQKFEAILAAHGLASDLNELDDPLLDLALNSMSKQVSLVPPLSTRLDLRTRYFWRQFVRSKRRRQAYNVHAPKKRNDGIDFTLFTYLALPAFVVTKDSGLLSGLADIPSFQARWFLNPGKLVTAWNAGDRPRPSWPQ
jgi:hypothetical protein